MAIQTTIEAAVLKKAKRILANHGMGQRVAQQAEVDYRRVSQLKTGKRKTLMEEEAKRFTDYINAQP